MNFTEFRKAERGFSTHRIKAGGIEQTAWDKPWSPSCRKTVRAVTCASTIVRLKHCFHSQKIQQDAPIQSALLWWLKTAVLGVCPALVPVLRMRYTRWQCPPMLLFRRSCSPEMNRKQQRSFVGKNAQHGGLDVLP